MIGYGRGSQKGYTPSIIVGLKYPNFYGAIIYIYIYFIWINIEYEKNKIINLNTIDTGMIFKIPLLELQLFIFYHDMYHYDDKHFI